MYTKKIELHEISCQAYRALDIIFSGKRIDKNQEDVFAQIVNPVGSDENPILHRNRTHMTNVDYKAAIEYLVDHPHVYEISVREGDHQWQDHLVRGMSNRDIRGIATLAEADPQRHNFLRVEFRKNPGDRREYAKINFHEHKGRLIGHQVRTVLSHADLFTTTGAHYKFKTGLYVPPDVLEEHGLTSSTINLASVRVRNHY